MNLKTGALLLLVGSMGLLASCADREDSEYAYGSYWEALVKEKKCVFQGYAGREATPYYKCSDGTRKKHRKIVDG